MPEETNSENPIQSTATAIATLAREVPIYDDAIQPSARSLGRGLGGILTWIMQPFIMLGIKAQHNIDRFEEEYAERIRDTPPEKLEAPDPTISGPALQALSYTIHQDELRRMFVNLLASASNVDTRNDTHPAFVEIIRQLTQDEAKLLRHLASSSKTVMPAVSISRSAEGGGQVNIKEVWSPLALDASCEFPDKVETYLNNIARLGLIAIDMTRHLTAPGVYEKLMERIRVEGETIELVALGETRPPGTLVAARGLFFVTEFGREFMRACVI